MAREALPWYRTDKACWYVWRQGKRVRLHPDKAEAYRLWHRQELGLEQRRGLSIGEVIDAYLADAQARLKPSTLLSKRKVLLRFKRDKGDGPASAFGPAAALAWLGRQKWGESLRWLAGCIAKTAFRWVVAQGMLTANPLAGLRLKPPRSRGAEALVPAEAFAKLLAVAPACYRDALLTLHATGCRPGELCMVEARHCDLVQGLWRLPEHKTDRTGHARIVHLTTPALALCKALAEAHPEGPLFRNCKGEPLTPDRLRNWLFKARCRLGLGRVIAYGFRHGFATDGLASGVADAQVAALLGHSTATLHRHYSHLTARARALREALSKVRG